MVDPQDLPDFAQEYARAFLDDSAATVVDSRLAASVILVRDGDGSPGSIEAFFQRRAAAMAFAASAAVFPGGGVDLRDADWAAGTRWVGPELATWSRRLGLSEDRAKAVICAAVRETYEESGVLLAGPDPHSVVADLSGPDWEDDRAALEARTLSLGELLDKRGLLLRSDLLQLWRCWLTPEFEPKRYRTYFFLATLPPGQFGRNASKESDQSGWMSVSDALQGAGQRHTLLPPQICTCAELVPYGTVTQLFEAAKDPRDVVAPALLPGGSDGRLRLELPPDLLAAVSLAQGADR